jgi:hypothetical protein
MWRRAVIRYLMFAAISNLAWEMAQLPLYSIWETGRPGALAFAVIHCTGGDILIALASWTLAVAVIGRDDWPRKSYAAVAVTATLVGLIYTFYSEWLNTEVRQSWAYAPAMSTLPFLGTGLSPVLQWLILPPLGFWWAHRGVMLDKSEEPVP